MKGNCGECSSRWYCDINPDECDAWPDPVPMTNADHIRSMTDEELSVLLSKPWCENHRLKEECLRFDTDCQACVADWLKQLYGGDT